MNKKLTFLSLVALSMTGVAQAGCLSRFACQVAGSMCESAKPLAHKVYHHTSTTIAQYGPQVGWTVANTPKIACRVYNDSKFLQNATLTHVTDAAIRHLPLFGSVYQAFADLENNQDVQAFVKGFTGQSMQVSSQLNASGVDAQLQSGRLEVLTTLGKEVRAEWANNDPTLGKAIPVAFKETPEFKETDNDHASTCAGSDVSSKAGSVYSNDWTVVDPYDDVSGKASTGFNNDIANLGDLEGFKELLEDFEVVDVEYASSAAKAKEAKPQDAMSEASTDVDDTAGRVPEDYSFLC